MRVPRETAPPHRPGEVEVMSCPNRPGPATGSPQARTHAGGNCAGFRDRARQARHRFAVPPRCPDVHRTDWSSRSADGVDVRSSRRPPRRSRGRGTARPTVPVTGVPGPLRRNQPEGLASAFRAPGQGCLSGPTQPTVSLQAARSSGAFRRRVTTGSHGSMAVAQGARQSVAGETTPRHRLPLQSGFHVKHRASSSAGST